MNQLSCISVEAFIILGTLVLYIQAKCYWETTLQSDCRISCWSSYSYSGTETIEETLADLEENWKEVTKTDFCFFMEPAQRKLNSKSFFLVGVGWFFKNKKKILCTGFYGMVIMIIVAMN